jgi:hypothetical protein
VWPRGQLAVGWDSPEKTERDLKSHIEYLLISQKPRCRFLLDRLGEESELSDAAHVYHHEGNHAGVDLEPVLD